MDLVRLFKSIFIIVLTAQLSPLEYCPGYAKVAGLIPIRGTCRNQPMDAQMGGTANQCLCLLLPLFL